MRDSLDLYGHSQPMLFYTDNMADKQFLEACFPSLREDVIAVDKFAHLPPLTIPETVTVYVKETVSAIDQAIATIFHQVPDGLQLAVGFDAEWNVDLLRGQTRDRTSVIQLAYMNQIYVF